MKGRRGGATKKEGVGASDSEVLPLQKEGGGAEKVLAMLKGGTTSFGVVLTQELEVLDRGERGKFYPVLGGGGAQKVLELQFSHFVAPAPCN